MLRILIILISVVSGSAAVWLTLQMQPSEPSGAVIGEARAQPVAPPAIRYEEVLVAAGDLAARHRVVEADLHWQSWPEDAVGPGFVTRADQPDLPGELVGSMVRYGIFAGEPINQEKVSSGERGFLSALLPSGMRAVAVRVTAETMAGGFVLPDDRVDVLHTTVPDDAGGTPKGVGRTILTNIRVLAVDQQSASAEAETVVPGKTATLQLTSFQAEVIAGAEAVGTLSLALRSTADDAEPTVNAEPLVVAEPVKVVEPSEAPNKGWAVSIISPGQVQVVQVN